jgi:riboflavin synthase
LFTGIIESFGTVRRVESKGEGKVLSIHCDLDLSGTRIGDSIAVNGACLTAVGLGNHVFKVDMAPETVERTTFKDINVGSRVNIERALKLSDRIDGHLVSGHIDGTGTIVAINRKSNAIIVRIEVAQKLAAQMIEKGSVAVEGISLTINECTDRLFDVSVIPHTASVTTIGVKQVGDQVNIETDMIGKYIQKYLLGSSATDNTFPGKTLNGKMTGKADISMELLAKNGFI